MSPPARWMQMDSPVKPANDAQAGQDRAVSRPYPTTVTLRLDRRVHVPARALDADGFAGQAGE